MEVQRIPKRTVSVIEPQKSILVDKEKYHQKRVAAYCRVSTDSEEQLTSYQNQMRVYTEMIAANKEWEFAGLYADEGISGTRADKRPEFQRMIAECEAGHIDIILTKSFSRFARNTLDMLVTIRRLKELGISVRFEKEGIDTLTESGELLLTLLASFAQEESRSISENVKWGVRKRMEQGIPNGRFRILGYRWQDGRLVVVPEEAAIVRRIFQDFLDGKSRLETERALDAEGIRTINGCRFQDSSLKCILTNITYTGNLILQKEYITDPIDGKRKKNHGELPQFFVADTHEAIIDRGTFDFVHQEMARRRALGARANKSLNISCFTGVIKCACHGCSFIHNSRKNRAKNPAYHMDTVVYWNCNMTKKKGGHCATKAIPEQKLKAFCADAMGLPAFDETVFTERIERITISGQRHVEIAFRDGTTKEFDWVSTGHQECWTSEARERKRQMMLERWAKQKCQR